MARLTTKIMDARSEQVSGSSVGGRSKLGRGHVRSMNRLVRRLRWWVAKPIMQPILDDMAEYERNLRRSATMENSPREWRIACLEKADTLSAYQTEIKEAFYSGLRCEKCGAPMQNIGFGPHLTWWKCLRCPPNNQVTDAKRSVQ